LIVILLRVSTVSMMGFTRRQGDLLVEETENLLHLPDLLLEEEIEHLLHL